MELKERALWGRMETRGEFMLKLKLYSAPCSLSTSVYLVMRIEVKNESKAHGGESLEASRWDRER